MRLNGWQRIGVVLTACWMIGAPMYWQSDEDKHRQTTKDMYYRWCMEDRLAAKSSDFSSCYEEAETKLYRRNPVWAWFLLAAIPIPFVWTLIYFVLAVIRWVRAGFRQSGDQT